MQTPTRLLALAAVFATAAVSSSFAGTYANISVLDESFDDWAGIDAVYTDPIGDGDPGDIHQIFLANNDTHLFIRVVFNAEINPNAGSPSLFIGIDNDSNTATGFDVYGLGLIGSEAAWQNDFAFEQATGVFNTGATTSGANAGISPYYTVTIQQEISISRAAIIDAGNNQQVFPNTSFNLALYFNAGTVDDFAGPVAYTFASSTIPEPSAAAIFAGAGVLSLAFGLRRRRR